MKRKLYKMLSAMLTAVMLMGLIVLPTSASGCNGDHSWGLGRWLTGAEAQGKDCVWGGEGVEIFVETCSKCGQERHTAARNWKTVGSHTYETHTYYDVCKNNPTIEKVCTRCKTTEVIQYGGHNWVEGAIVGSSNCKGDGTQYYTCSYCGEQKTEKIPAKGNHTWAVKETVEPTCTQNGYQVVICTVCHTESTVGTNMVATGHRWVNQDGNVCTGTQVCSKCGETRANPGHSFNAGYERNSTQHWHVCSVCGEKTGVEEHSFLSNGKCVCGYVKSTTPEKCSHTWKIAGKTSTFTHKEVCSKCGAERSVNCSQSTFTVPRQYCTETLYCQCGNVAQEGQKNHNYGTWMGSKEAHEKKCLNPGCNEKKVAQHELKTVSLSGGALTNYQCTVCGVVAKSVKNDAATPGTQSTQHTHSYGTWINKDAQNHVRTCTVHGCTETVTETHTPGAADCTGKATCTKCGATVTTTKGANHVGGTKIVGEKRATATAEGYTGDTVCVGCDAVLIPGRALEKLKADHTHTYNVVRHDTKGHWHECGCGAKGPVEAHTGGTATCASGAKCAICGEVYGGKSNVHVGGTKVTNARAAQVGVDGYTGDTCCVGCGAVLLKGETIPALKGQHTHAYETLKHDSTGHWKECECGAKQQKAEHTYKDGVCTVCGEKEPIKVEEHVHSYSTEWEGDSTSHWHVCESCGLEADKTVHAFLDGKCLDCGMTVEVKEQKEAEEEKAKVEAEANRVNAVETFNDVKENDWFAGNVQEVLDRQIMKGTGTGATFSPNKATTRRELVTILARASGVDTTPGNSTWYYPGLAWATALGVNEGYPDSDGNKNITRSELVVMMYRTAGKPAVADDELKSFADASSVTGEVKDAFNWAVSTGVVNGKNGNRLAPNDTTNRGEIAAVVTRYLDHKGL